MNQEQLAAVICVQSQTLGRVVAGLEARGLVTRKRNPHDRRQLQVEITDAGERTLRAAREAERPPPFPQTSADGKTLGTSSPSS